MPARERRRAKRAFERARFVCPVSRDLARHVQAVAPRATVEPVPNPVDADVFAPGASLAQANDPRLITVGSLVDVKGHRHLLEAIALLVRDGSRPTLDVVGDGPLRADLEAQARELGIDELVRFAGRKDKPDVAAALRSADLFVLPSLWENLPCALLEALSTGLPVVATRVGGVPEVLDEGDGILVEPGSAEALADALTRMAADHLRYDGRRLRAKAVAGFGYDAIAQRWAGLYASAVGGRAA
jgi:glycosyltransferase involved in cell wall biosynthesis